MEEDGPISNTKLKRILLILNSIILAIGTAASPLVMRLYFIHGGKRLWLLSWLQTGGWPVIIIPLAISYIQRCQRGPAAISADGGSGRGYPAAPRSVLMKPFLFTASAIIGILSGVDNYFYAYGVSLLPVSTSSLIIASQLAFTATFAFLLVKQKFTAYSTNSVFLLTPGAVVLALHTGSDRPEGESDRQYMLGFIMTAAAAVLYGFILPLVELSYKKGKQVMTYSLVLEYQLVLCFFATAACTIGMLINKDFQAIPREAKEYGLGEFKYYMVLVWNAIMGQFFFLGAVGVIFCASSLFSGILISLMLPLTEVLAVIFFKEKFQAEKGVSLALSLWGFVSYFYGEFKHTKKRDRNPHQSQNQIQHPPSEVELNGHSIP
ncbi:purine permease 3-like [Punica granatum]|uniref:Purine permease 3-like n=3 Tax=Punica granatum TaxID=22663 RepID=A0A6P8DSQ9_PUNGR|nr:purine permease 3-like [Punica granatum]PKI47346.1 hypothetical protein CRG98_032271 [Punica granatum]